MWGEVCALLCNWLRHSSCAICVYWHHWHSTNENLTWYDVYMSYVICITISHIREHTQHSIESKSTHSLTFTLTIKFIAIYTTYIFGLLCDDLELKLIGCACRWLLLLLLSLLLLNKQLAESFQFLIIVFVLLTEEAFIHVVRLIERCPILVIKFQKTWRWHGISCHMMLHVYVPWLLLRSQFLRRWTSSIHNI